MVDIMYNEGMNNATTNGNNEMKNIKRNRATVRLSKEQGELVWLCILPHKVRYAWEGGREQAEVWAEKWNKNLK